jgi:adsorption protein B
MGIKEILYTIGLVLAIFYITTGFDDFVWDVITLIKVWGQKKNKLEIKELDSVPPKLLAIMIAAWHEENVLESVIDNIISSQIYPKTMYHIFLGVYPNDTGTVEIAKELEKKYANIHCIVNCKEGPTSKAQNLNYVIKQIKEFEKENNFCFASFTIHDSEDVVHPYELKVTNYLINNYPALQFPVFPLIKKPKITNFFENITTNTYVDEFAENHFITMVNRHRSGAFVPSAGTGFSLSRETIESLGENVLPENSLTEDYRLSLSLYEQGIQMYYVMERLKRVNWQGDVSWDYIATRSIFPNTFKAAVKQKTRWTLGITMQSYQMKEIFNNDLSFIGRYSLYRDQKAKIGNLLSGVGYPVLIYFLISLFKPVIPIYPYYSLSWYLSLVVTIMMIERQLLRAISLYNVYGFRSVFYGTLFPPLVPLRIVWGNIINFTATFKAYLQYLKKDDNNKKIEEKDELDAEEVIVKETVVKKETEHEQLKSNKERKFVWAKTEHDFLDKNVLERFHRKLGDIMIEKGYIDPKQLKSILNNKPDNCRLGDYLIKENIVFEKQMIECLSILNNETYLYEEALKYYNILELSKEYKKSDLIENSVIPLYKNNEVTTFAYCEKSPLNLKERLIAICKTDVHLVLSSYDTIKIGLDIIYGQVQNFNSINIESEIEAKYSVEQVLIIRNYAAKMNNSEENILKKMGLMYADNIFEESKMEYTEELIAET